MKNKLMSLLVSSMSLWVCLAAQANVMQTNSACDPSTQACVLVNGLDARMLNTPFGDTHGPSFNFTYANGAYIEDIFSDDVIKAGLPAYLPVDKGLTAFASKFSELGADCEAVGTIKPVPNAGIYAVITYTAYQCPPGGYCFYSCTITN